MFDVSWTEILIIGVVALIVVGPKELPALLRTLGRYMGVVKRQAAEFRAQFDEAMRETELEQLKKDVETVGRDMESTVREAERDLDKEMDEAKRQLDQAADAAKSEADAGATVNGAPALSEAPADQIASTSPAANGAALPEPVDGNLPASPASGAEAKPGA